MKGGFVRSKTYLRFERIPRPEPETIARPVPVVEPTRQPFGIPPVVHRNQGAETNPQWARAQLDDAGATERQILRQIRDAVTKAK